MDEIGSLKRTYRIFENPKHSSRFLKSHLGFSLALSNQLTDSRDDGNTTDEDSAKGKPKRSKGRLETRKKRVGKKEKIRRRRSRRRRRKSRSVNKGVKREWMFVGVRNPGKGGEKESF